MKFGRLKTLVFTHPIHNDLAWALLSTVIYDYYRSPFKKGGTGSPQLMEIMHEQLVHVYPALKVTDNFEQVIDPDVAVDRIRISEIFQFIISCLNG
jgi:hypothetical protein